MHTERSSTRVYFLVEAMSETIHDSEGNVHLDEEAISIL